MCLLYAGRSLAGVIAGPIGNLDVCMVLIIRISVYFYIIVGITLVIILIVVVILIIWKIYKKKIER